MFHDPSVIPYRPHITNHIISAYCALKSFILIIMLSVSKVFGKLAKKIGLEPLVTDSSCRISKNLSLNSHYTHICTHCLYHCVCLWMFNMAWHQPFYSLTWNACCPVYTLCIWISKQPDEFSPLHACFYILSPLLSHYFFYQTLLKRTVWRHSIKKEKS